MAVVVPGYTNLLEKARVSRAISEIATLGQKLEARLSDYGTLPESLVELKLPTLTDPWGNPYQYLIIWGKAKNEIQGKWRKDKFLVPLNDDFDLYSMGEDGKSVASLTAQASWDDTVRANNGEYVGLASKY